MPFALGHPVISLPVSLSISLAEHALLLSVKRFDFEGQPQRKEMPDSLKDQYRPSTHLEFYFAEAHAGLLHEKLEKICDESSSHVEVRKKPLSVRKSFICSAAFWALWFCFVFSSYS